MIIRWHGHACFEIRNDHVIVTDPHEFIHDVRSYNSGGPRTEAGNFTLEFVGIKISG